MANHAWYLLLKGVVTFLGLVGLVSLWVKR